MKEDKTSKRIRIKNSLVLMTVVPIILMGLVFVFISVRSIKESREAEVIKTLSGVCTHTRDTFYQKYPGNYSYNNGKLYSDGVNISEDTQFIDDFKKHFDVEVAIFYKDIRVLTTIEDKTGRRLVETTQDDQRVLSAVSAGNMFYANDIIINNEGYYGVYVPLYDNAKVCGMVFSGLSNENFNQRIMRFYVEVILLALVAILVVFTYVSYYANSIAEVLYSIKEYLGMLVKKQTSEVEMPQEVLNRNDEIGDLGRYAVMAGEQLKVMIGTDPLTRLYNRRTGMQYLEMLWERNASHPGSFSLVMCDIDYFKNINDTYGHDKGDMVLSRVSSIISKYCDDKSFAIRWGGEEFIIAIEKDSESALNMVKVIQAEIRNEIFKVGSEVFGATMTFGFETYSDHKSIAAVIVEADSKLYIGKNNNRDQIVT